MKILPTIVHVLRATAALPSRLIACAALALLALPALQWPLGSAAAIAAIAATTAATAADGSDATPSAPDSAARSTVPGLTVRDPWIRWLPAGLPAGGYVTLANGSDRPLVLVSASSDAYVQISLHRSMQQSGMSKMTPVSSITIPAHRAIDFAAAGYHFMLMQPRHALSPGQQVRITLHFAGGTAQTVEFQVRKPGSTEHHASMPGMGAMPR